MAAAGEATRVSQPSLSNGINTLKHELGDKRLNGRVRF